MAEKKEYRSAVRSRRLIRQAFIELLREKNFEKITVTDIVTRADINRSTFYAHYPDTVGVVEEIQNEVFDKCRELISNVKFYNFFEAPKPILDGIIELIEENREIYMLLEKSGIANQQMEKVKAIYIQMATETLDFPEEYSKLPQYEISMRFFIGGVVDVYTQWLKGGLKVSLNEITETLEVMIKQGTQQIISELQELQ